MIIGLSAKRRGGKTTLAEILRQEFGWNHLSLAQTLKERVRNDFGLTVDHTDGDLKEVPLMQYPRRGGAFYTPRDIMTRVGLIYREIDAMFWIRQLAKKVDPTNVNVISDIRFINEARWVKGQGGMLVRLEREEELTGPYINDPSETELDSYPDFDLVLEAKRNRTQDDLASFALALQTHVISNSGGRC